MPAVCRVRGAETLLYWRSPRWEYCTDSKSNSVCLYQQGFCVGLWLLYKAYPIVLFQTTWNIYNFPQFPPTCEFDSGRNVAIWKEHHFKGILLWCRHKKENIKWISCVDEFWHNKYYDGKDFSFHIYLYFHP